MQEHVMNEAALADLLWAKTNPNKQLIPHMIDTGNCAKAYLESPASSAILSFLMEQWNCNRDHAIAFTAYLISMHDIGKATPQFQMQSEEQFQRLKSTAIRSILPEKALPPVRHEYLSGLIAKRIWKSGETSHRILDAYSCILTLHHQKPDESERHKPKVHECWQQIQGNIEAQIRSAFSFEGNLPITGEMDAVCMLLTGILILCDWVASSGPFDCLPEITNDYCEKSYNIAQKALKRYGLIEQHQFKSIKTFQSLWPKIKTPRDIQIKCEALVSDAPLTIIEAPMGEGKTEAALYTAVRAMQSEQKRGIYVALPTQATSNQMYGRFVHMLEDNEGGNARLLHGTAFLMKQEAENIQSEDAVEAEKWLGTSRMGLLDENGVGTVDQAMGAVLLARFSVLRLLGLANKVLIIDELHAYDAYMSEIIESLLQWCHSLKIPVVLLSATLQKAQRVRYLSCFTEQATLPILNESYPLITQVTSTSKILQTEAKASMQTVYLFETVCFGEDEAQIARFSLSKVQKGGCYCILANTVRRAQTIYQQLQAEAEPDTEILLFHARFPMGRREAIEKECLTKFGKSAGSNRPAKAVLVATQVVEQSLDIDFDGMISELAPVDLLLQRAGRVHRHRDRIRPDGFTNPVIHVVVPSENADNDPDNRYGLSGYVYAPFLLYNTENLLGKGIPVKVPDDVRKVISQVYEHVNVENMKSWQERAFTQQLMTANADRISYPHPAKDYFFPSQSHPEFENMNIDDGFDPSARAATRLGEPTFRIAFTDPEHLLAAQEGCLTKGQQKEILLSSVSLRETQEIRSNLNASNICRIRKGALNGCYVTDASSMVEIGHKKLINDPTIGVYWEG